MGGKNILAPYKKEFDYSYAFGAYAVIELIGAKPETVKAVYVHSKYTDLDRIKDLCSKHGIPVINSDRSFERINRKENCYVVGVFSKFICELSAEKPHIVLVNPSDMGNIGTIIRTMAGLELRDLAMITPAADVFNPRTVRASMGSLFHINVCEFMSFEEYRIAFPEHKCFPFMLDAELTLNYDNCPETRKFSLIFGNEATGLPASFARVGSGIKIPVSPHVDSLNLAVAAGIGIFEFMSKNRT